MDTQKQRYIFTDYRNIRTVKFKKLEKICQKLFILIDASEEMIPFSLVRDLQRFGRSAKWLPIKDSEHSLNYHICYMIGKLHSKLDKDVEFAILSEDKAFDSLIKYINKEKRSCIRIRIRKETTPPTERPIVPEKVRNDFQVSDNKGKAPKDTEQKPYTALILSNQELIAKAAHSTVHRLQLSKDENRPFNLNALYEYIQFSNQETTSKANVEVTEVINYLIDKGYVRINGDEVKYSIPE